jgi:hypothetical protein
MRPRAGIVCDRDDESAPQRGAAVGVRHLLLARIHAPENSAEISPPAVDLVEHTPVIDDVQIAVLREWCGFQIRVRRCAAEGNRVGEWTDRVPRAATVRPVRALSPTAAMLVVPPPRTKQNSTGVRPRRIEGCATCASFWRSWGKDIRLKMGRSAPHGTVYPPDDRPTPRSI